MTGLLGVLMHVWIIVEFYLHGFTTGWSSAQSHRLESSRSAGNCAVYYKFTLQGQPVALMQQQEYKRSAYLCHRW